MLAWNLLDGSLIFQTARGDAARVFYSSDKTEIYAVNASGLSIVHDANTGAVKATFEGSDHYANIATYSAEDGWLALGGTDGAINVWDTYERQSLVTIDAHSTLVTALAFSPDGDLLASAGDDSSVRVWRWRDRAMLAETMLERPVSILRLAFAPDGRRLAVGSDRDAQLWSFGDNTADILILNTGRGGASQILTFSPDGRYLLGGNQGAGLSLWTLDSPPLAAPQLAARLPDTSGTKLAASFSPDSNLLLTVVLNGKVALWNLAQITTETVNQADLPVGTQQILNVEWTNDGRLLMFFDASGPIYLWGITG
jgi:WD40 repeat protein